MPFLVVDIDGTCSDLTHRLHHIQGSKKDWDAFHDEVGNDASHADIRLIVWALRHAADIIYMSGRMERCRKDTVYWLAKHGFPTAKLYMRADGDFRQDYIVKSEWADRLGLSSDNVFCVLDDRQQVVDMWRSRGIRVLQVASGNF